jgi:D-glycero-D-manno-heptose 1,7-bisphosphate phosphatase
MAERAVFLDRDGTVIVDKDYLATVEGVELLPGAGEALARLAGLGFRLVLVSNQSGVGRGYFPAAIVHAQFARLQQLLLPYGVTLAHLEFCPHAPEEQCACRKPQPGMLLAAAAKLDLDCAASYMIGDKSADVGAGRAAGCRTVRLGTTDGEADYVAPDLPAAAAWIAQQVAPAAVTS